MKIGQLADGLLGDGQGESGGLRDHKPSRGTSRAILCANDSMALGAVRGAQGGETGWDRFRWSVSTTSRRSSSVSGTGKNRRDS